MNAEDTTADVGMSVNDLYREDVFTDRRVGTIRRLTPVTAEGADDDSRPVVYVGQTQMMTSVGAVPLSFEIPGQSLAEAAVNFAAEAQQAVERTMQELQELRREAASSIVIPQGGAGSGMPGGGKIQIP